MRYGRLLEARHLRSVTHHNMPISMNEKNNLTCINLKFTKIMIWGVGGGVMVESFLVVSSGGDEAGGRGGSLSSDAYCSTVHCEPSELEIVAFSRT